MILETRRAPDLAPDRPQPVEWGRYVSWLMEQWRSLLDDDPPEPDVQAFLDQNACLLPGAAHDVGPGGHQGPCWDAVIRQPQLKGLNKDRIPDFMWVLRDTGAIRPICIEIEAPGKPWFNINRTPNGKLTQALDQLVEWKLWFSEPENLLLFRREYVPVEYSHRPIKPQYVLIYGRDSEFRPGLSRHKSPGKVRRKRDFLPRDAEHFFTYDMLEPREDAANYATIMGRAGAFSASAVPPTLTTGPETQRLAAEVSDVKDAVMNAPLMSAERKEYLLQRWVYWRNTALEARPGVTQGTWGE